MTMDALQDGALVYVPSAVLLAAVAAYVGYRRGKHVVEREDPQNSGSSETVP